MNAEAGIDHMVDYLACSFMDMGAVADDTFDRGYAIESTCHAPDKAGAFAEIYRVLSPGALFWGQEMCLTDKFDPDDSRHRALKQDLMHGVALKDIATMAEVDRALQTAGFEVVEGRNLAVGENGPSMPWYHPMEAMRGMPGSALRRTPLGRKLYQGGSQAGRGVAGVPQGLGGRPRSDGSYRQCLCRGRQGRDLHAVVLFPGP